MSKKFEIVNGDLSDGYHTFDELYEHRCLLFINLVLKSLGDAQLKKDHYDGWDCIYLETCYGQISYHVPVRMRPLYIGKISECTKDIYDGHKPKDVLDRLLMTARFQ